jgi:lactate permease
VAALTGLGVAWLLALVAYGMPVRLAVMATITGAAYGLFPIAWIVLRVDHAVPLAVDTGKFAIIKDSVGGLTDDRACRRCSSRSRSGRSSKAPPASARRSRSPARCSSVSGSRRSMRRASA